MAEGSQNAWFSPYLRTLEYCANAIAHSTFSPGSVFSIFSLLCALLIAVAFLAYRRARKGKPPVRLRVLARALFPRWFWRSASMRADIGFYFLNTVAIGGFIGWGLISANTVSHLTIHALTGALGPSHASPLPHIVASAWLTLALFVAYDFAYWIDHYLSHKIPVLWDFHRVHHTAETLSPLTNARVHPVDSLIFANITGLCVGSTHGVVGYFLGNAASEAMLSGTNVIYLGFLFAVVHLQHSHVPIQFGRRLNRIFFSPAHHHIHHSTRPEHFNSNLGSCLAVWDWMFGTLIDPQEVKGRLTFGVEMEGDRYTPHSMAGTLVWPFVRAARRAMPRRTPAKTAANTAYELSP
ncbi:MAG TPA: sterol desaturase family protein [Rhizomicrobium sp.]|nr:sterol desaturase family protein [Rhizomicrobium sp.]